MAIDDFGVTVTEVLDDFPGDTRLIQQSVGPLSKDDLDRYIDDGASKIAGKLERFGLDAADLDDEAERQAQIAVREYAIMRGLSDMQHTGDDYDAASERYQRAIDDLQDRSEIDKSNSAYDSNVPSGNQHHDSKWVGQSWKM